MISSSGGLILCCLFSLWRIVGWNWTYPKVKLQQCQCMLHRLITVVKYFLPVNLKPKITQVHICHICLVLPFLSPLWLTSFCKIGSPRVLAIAVVKSIQEKKRYRQVVAVVVVIVVVVVVVVVVLSSKAIFSLAVALNSFYPLRLFPAKITTKYFLLS